MAVSPGHSHDVLSRFLVLSVPNRADSEGEKLQAPPPLHMAARSVRWGTHAAVFLLPIYELGKVRETGGGLDRRNIGLELEERCLKQTEPETDTKVSVAVFCLSLSVSVFSRY